MENLSSTLSALEALSPHLDLSGITTKSDLLECLIERHHAWRQHDKAVLEYLHALLPKEEMNDFLAAVDRKADEDRMLSERLIKCLVGAGIPVIRESLESLDGCEGTLYGYTKEGAIHLNSSLMDPMTPIHEYAHLWLTAIEVTEPDTWERLKEELKECEAWQAWKQGRATDENRLAEEWLAYLVGKEGTAQLRKESGSTWEKVRRVVRHFWEAVCRFFHLPVREARSLPDRLLGDLARHINPRDFLRSEEERERYNWLNADLRPLFIGEKGAGQLDTPDFFSNRLGSLETAIQMERDARDPHAIKMSTGWERGVDLLWRYELPAARLKEDGFSLKELKNGVSLDSLLEAPELFEAYPELRQFTVKANDKMDAQGTIYFKDRLILLNTGRVTIDIHDMELTKRILLETIVHETQHAIQHIEGFSTGTTEEACMRMLLKRDYPSLPDLDSDVARVAALLLRNDRSAGTLKRLGPGEVIRQLKGMLRTKDVLEGVATVLEVVERYRNETAFNRLVDEANAYFKVKKNISNQYNGEASRTYLNTAGEVEARNAGSRLRLTEAERKRSLASDTMDVPLEKQVLITEGNSIVSAIELRRRR